MAQTCENSGIVNATSNDCECLTGFGGTNCSQPACGGTIFQGRDRALVSTSSNGFANLTAAACKCEGGWTGLGCNVCQTPNACASGYSSVSGSSTPSVMDGVQNTTMVCNSTPRVWAAGQMSCAVNNPTLRALYPLDATLNIMRNLNPSSSPLPNTTSFGDSGTAYAQLFYAGVEQFYCSADSCDQDTTDGGASWTCSNLTCKCRSGTSMCGAPGSTAITSAINGLSGTLTVDCDPVQSGSSTSKCAFKQATLQSLFGSGGLTLEGCTFGECVQQYVIDNNGNSATASAADSGSHLGGGVIAGLAVVGALLFLAILMFVFGFVLQRKARKVGPRGISHGGVGVEWSNITYVVPAPRSFWGRRKQVQGYTNDKTILDSVTGRIQPGQMMAILGPSGAGKTTLVDILAQKPKSGQLSGSVQFTGADRAPRIGFVSQQDVLPPMLTSIPEAEKISKVEHIMERLGIAALRNSRIGEGKARGISGGEMRRVSIGLELIASPDVLILDEPTSGLDSVSASRVGNLLHDIAHDPENPTAVIASIHQPSSHLYQTFDQILVLAHGNAIYTGPGGFAPVEHFNALGAVPAFPGQGYNVADYLLDVASDPPFVLLQSKDELKIPDKLESRSLDVSDSALEQGKTPTTRVQSGCATTFLTQLQCLSGREWKILKRDKTLFLTHIIISSILGVFCGGLYYQTDLTIAGFQSRVGCLFFLGALIAFSSLSALYNIVEIRPLFLRERSSSYYSPTTWLLSRFLFDVVPLRIIPTIIVSTITYWMAGLSHEAANFFKFLLILVLYTLALTLFNFLLGALFQNGGVAILLSALTALYQMTFAGFFVHLDAIPPVLRWLQWLCPLKYCLEALAVNEVGSGLMIQDSLAGVPVNVSASLIMNTLFGFGSNNYYRDVLVLFAFIAGFGLGVIGVVWLRVRERR
ncbi:hypothetical protein CPB85DRAFT_1375640 [Mucidula mucida]|nr:hypothetical protein CPB85DRAFT_1375640 [Mucidula mucida]